MTREEAIAIIRQEYLCVDRDCNIEKNCGKCDLAMPSKEPILEAYKMAIEALEQETCDDCISRSKVLEGKVIHQFCDGVEIIDSYAVPVEYIEQLPPVTPAEKVGRWIKTIGENGITSAIRCSECGFEDNRYMLFRYCPNCGAKIKEVEE